MKFFKKFIGDEERDFVNLVLEESKLTRESIHKLAQLLTLITQGKGIEKLVEEINELERKVDDIRTKAEGEVYKTTFLPLMRVDRLELLEDIDTIADISEEIAILFRMRKPKICLRKRSIKELSNSLSIYEVLRERRRDARGKIYGVYEEIFRDKSISIIDADIMMEVLRKIMVMCRKIGDVGDRARAMVIKYL
jgi:uncharacterized protein Yka (UPF0111/DUF47 family)